MNDYYEPIIRKIQSWIDYDKNKPKSNYYTNREEHDEYRSKNDLDCILANGNLNADTIFSLWLPLRLVLVKLNGYAKLNKYGGIKKEVPFLKIIKEESILEELLPQKNCLTGKLIELFDLGQQRCNVMILKNREMQSRGLAPYYDYMPYFLFECFDKGCFSKYFNGNDDLIKWISQQNLDMFFYDTISKENIKDLSGNGDIKNNVPYNIEVLLENYINILKQRKMNLNET